MIKTEIVLQDNSGTIELLYDNEPAGHIKFSILPNGDMDIVHTVVDSKFGGKGLGNELVLAAVHFAEAKNLKIHTTCSFAAKVFTKTPAIQSVWVS